MMVRLPRSVAETSEHSAYLDPADPDAVWHYDYLPDEDLTTLEVGP